MAQPTPEYFAALTELVEQTLDKISLKRLEYNPQRALWEVHGVMAQFTVRCKEIFIQAGRMYSYYVIEGDNVAMGFDNYPDRQALQQKYGQAFMAHLDELIPHKHGPGKTTLELTEDMMVERFLSVVCQELLEP